MPSSEIETLRSQIEKSKSLDASCRCLLLGLADRFKTALAAALANGATAEQLAPVQAEVDTLCASTDALCLAVKANVSTVP